MCLHEAGHHVTGGARYGLIVCWLTWPWQAIYRSVLETSARLLRLLSLLQTHRDWPGKDLSERLEVTPRTVRRDVERLRLLGYPVQARPGAGGGYRLGSGAVLPPLLLGDDEAVAIAVGLRSATLSGIAGIEETAVLALAKLVLPVSAAAPGPDTAGGDRADDRPRPQRRRRGAARGRLRRTRLPTTAGGLPPPRRYREPTGTRAAPDRAFRAPLVPRRLGRRACRLADVPGSTG